MGTKKRKKSPHTSRITHPKSTPRPFSLLIKPAGPCCNLACSYCFYLPKKRLFTDKNAVGEADCREAELLMNDEVLETMIRSYLQTSQSEYIFNWQGGEPTLMGLDFFKRVVELQKRHAPTGSRVSNTLQTNGTLLDGEWADFLAAHSFLVGVSLDGPKEIHDFYRKDARGEGSFDQVMGGIEELRKAGARFNILTMVTSRSAIEAQRIFRFFREQGFFYQQYIPCYESDTKGRPLHYSVGSEEWGRFLVDLFHAWYPREVRKISVGNFDNIVTFLATGEQPSCAMRGACNGYFVVEHEGSVYPCDFFVEPEYRLGCILEDQWSALQGSPLYRKFSSGKNRWNETCSGCEYLDLCSGDCPKFRPFGKPSALSRLCRGNRLFFSETLSTFTELARQWRRSAIAPDDAVPLPPVSRDPNSPCFCGSGKKYKNCHMIS